MKTTFKRLATASLAAVLLVPGVVTAHETGRAHTHAEDNVRRKAETPRVAAAEICARFTELSGSLTGETNNRFKSLEANFASRGGKVNQVFADNAERLDENRGKADARRTEQLRRLEDKLTTDEHKAAGLAFKQAIIAAVTKRRAAHDAANAAYKTGLLAAINQRQASLKTAATAYRTAVTNAVTQAKNSCAARTAPSVVRTRLQNALKAARANLQTALKNAERIRPNLNPLKDARRAAISQANDTFKAEVKVALTALKVALGADGDVKPSPTPES